MSASGSGRTARAARVRRLFRSFFFAVLVLVLWWGSDVAGPGKRSSAGSAGRAATHATGGYEVLNEVRLVRHRRNDGDSFFIEHDGAEHEMRLYFVDCPEKYLGEHNARRLGHQARYFGVQETRDIVEVGLRAQEFTTGLLAAGPFDVYTSWEGVYGNQRHYCFVKLKDGSYLAEKLVAAGLARIYTKGEPTPDGRTVKQFKRHLESLEKRAKKTGMGAWQVQ